jgi:hypothetical protein
VTPGERQLDELVVSFAAIEPVLNDFARARVAARLRREIEELEAKEAAEYGEWATGRDEPGGSEGDGEDEEELGERWRAFDRDGLADARRKAEEDAIAREAERRAEREAEAQRQVARHQRRRWAMLAGSAAAAGALLGWLHSVRQGDGETTMVVSVLPVLLDPSSVPLVPGERMTEGLEVRRSPEAEAEAEAEAMAMSAKEVEAIAREVRANGSAMRPLDGISRAAPRAGSEQVTAGRGDGDEAGPGAARPLEKREPATAQLAEEAGQRSMVGATGATGAMAPPPSGPGELRSSGIATELEGISAVAAASASGPAPADEPTEYLRCAAATARGLPSALGCLASFRVRFPSSVYDSDALAALAVAAAETERCGEAMPLLNEYLARYPDRGKAILISRLRSRCEKRVLVLAPARS